MKIWILIADGDKEQVRLIVPDDHVEAVWSLSDLTGRRADEIVEEAFKRGLLGMAHDWNTGKMLPEVAGRPPEGIEGVSNGPEESEGLASI